MSDTIAAFKGFDKDLKCRGFQYEIGKTYEQDAPAQLCSTGFHAVLLPLDVFKYYLPNESVYHQVTLEGATEADRDDSKIAGRKITVGAQIGIPGLVKAHVEAVWNSVKKPSEKTKATTGDYAHAATTGYSAHAATTGDYAHAATTGRYANAATTGYSALVRASVKDGGSIAAVLGQGAASGTVGCWLVLTERDDYWNILDVQTVKVDGEKIKANVFYTLRGGEIVEVEK